MTSVLVMLETCERLQRELESGVVDDLRLREIETVLRLLLPQVTRALADAVHRVRSRPELSDASAALMSARACLDGAASHRSAGGTEIQGTLREATSETMAVLRVLERL